MGINTERYRVEYAQGRGARINGRAQNACPYGLSVIGQRMAWLGGWNDADIELDGEPAMITMTTESTRQE